jgi:hypothetical protein
MSLTTLSFSFCTERCPCGLTARRWGGKSADVSARAHRAPRPSRVTYVEPRALLEINVEEESSRRFCGKGFGGAGPTWKFLGSAVWLSWVAGARAWQILKRCSSDSQCTRNGQGHAHLWAFRRWTVTEENGSTAQCRANPGEGRSSMDRGNGTRPLSA